MKSEIEQEYMAEVSKVYPDLEKETKIQDLLIADGDAKAFFLKVAVNLQPEETDQSADSWKKQLRTKLETMLGSSGEEVDVLYSMYLQEPPEVLADLGIVKPQSSDQNNTQNHLSVENTSRAINEVAQKLPTARDVATFYCECQKESKAYQQDLKQVNGQVLGKQVENSFSIDLDSTAYFFTSNDSFKMEGQTVSNVINNSRGRIFDLERLLNRNKLLELTALELYGQILDTTFDKRKETEKDTIVELIEKYPRETLSLAALKNNDNSVVIHNVQDFQAKLTIEPTKKLAAHMHSIGINQSFSMLPHFADKSVDYTKDMSKSYVDTNISSYSNLGGRRYA